MKIFLYLALICNFTFQRLFRKFTKIYRRRIISNFNIPDILVLLIFFLFLFQKNNYAQSGNEIGLPLIKFFAVEDYSASGQNWDITQDNRGVMYFGNTSCVLEYDGNTWRRIPFPSIVRSVKSDHKGVVYVGAQGDFGYLMPDSTGTNQFISLLPYLSEKDRDFTNVWKTYVTEQGVYFNTLSHLFRWHNDSVKVWYPDNSFGWSFIIRDTLFIQQRGDAIYKMVNDSLELLPGTNEVARSTIFFMLPYGESQLLIGTRNRGLEIYDNENVIPFKTDIDEYLQENGLYYAKKLSDGTIAIGTSGGMVVIDENGTFKMILNETNGLVTKGILSLFSDHQGNLWLGMQNGIARLDWPSPLSRIEIDAHIEDIHRHMEMLYASGRYGVHYLAPASVDDNGIRNTYFREVRGLESLQCYDLLSFGKKLIVSTNNGLYEIITDRAELIGYENDWINSLERSRQDTTRIFGSGDGKLVALRLQNGKWIEEGKIQGLKTDEIRYVVEEDDGTLWLGTRYSGAIRIKFSDGFNLEPEIDRFYTDHGLPEGDTYVFPIQNRVVFATDSGLFRFDEQKAYFLPDIAFGENFAGKIGSREVFRMVEDNNGDIWMASPPQIGINRLKEDRTFFWDTRAFNRITYYNIYSIYPDINDVVWFGGNGGIYRYDPHIIKDYQSSYAALVRTIMVNSDSILFNGNHQFDRTTGEKQVYIPELRYNANEMRFDYAATDFSDESVLEYQYILEGFDKKWSSWTIDKRKEYTNLPGGDYTFRVKARNIYDHISQEGNYAFTILRPWWETWWAYLIFGVLFIGIISLIVIWYAQYRTWEQRKKLAKEQEINRRLKQVDKLKDQFLANTSHELRTPLQGIIGLSESLQERENEPGKKEDLALISTSGRRLSSLVNSILDFSKLKTHELQINPKSLDLRTITDVVLKMSVPLIKGKPLVLKNEIKSSIPMIRADEERIFQILHNLIGNAIKFTTEGEVLVDATTKEDKVQISVKDTGIGIPEDKLDDVFKSFEQVDASVTREYGGTGLGLTITKQLVELHGGDIWLESEREKGTTVFFTMPVSEEVAEIDERKVKLSRVREYSGNDTVEKVLVEKGGSRENSNKFNVLIVDDEPINQKVLSNHLASDTYGIFHALDGMEALNLIEKEHIDIVLLDIMMPKMSGYEVCQKIRERFLPSELPVIMITAKDQVLDLVEGLASGANDYLAKPFSKDEFLSRLKTHLNLYNINTAYLRFIPKEFIKALGKESIIDVGLGDQVHGEMTILFSDIRSFTSLTERISPEESFVFLNEYLSNIIPAITSNRGFIDKYIGDAIMALFPIVPEDALKAAFEVQYKLMEFNVKRKEEGKELIKIGIGIHTGPLMMGTIGVESRMDSTVISDAVNLASRLEGLTKLYGNTLIISEESMKKLENLEKYNHRFISKVRVKGKTEYTNIFEFFDGDDDYNKSMKIKTREEFEQGIQEYYQKQFTKASVHFQQVLDTYPEDITTRMFLEYSAKYMVHGVPEDWDGIDEVEKVF